VFGRMEWFCQLEDSSFLYSLNNMDIKNVDICNTLSTGQRLEHVTTGLCDNKSYRLEPEDHKGTLDSIWYKATEMCHSSQLKTFFRNKGKLSSLHVDGSTACNFLYVLSCYSFSIHLKISCIIV